MAEVNVTLVVLLVVTGVAIMLLWREAMRVLRASKQNESTGQKRGFVRRVTDYDEVLPDTSTQGDVDARFEAARMKDKGSLIRDMANQSPWKDAPPSAELAKSMSDDIEEVEDDHVGRMTIPSREIERVDRSDRLGEDMELTDRVAATATIQDVPKDVKDLLVDAHVAEKKAKREELGSVMDSLDEILDD